MDIGGYDFWAQPRSTQTTQAQFLDQVLNLIRSQWPDMVIDCRYKWKPIGLEEARNLVLQGEGHEHTISAHTLKASGSGPWRITLDIYRDQAARDAWDEDGGTPENEESVVSLSVDGKGNELSFVVGSREGPMGAFLLAELGITEGYCPHNRECIRVF